MWSNPQLVTFTEEILNGKLHFSCSVNADTIGITSVSLYFIA